MSKFTLAVATNEYLRDNGIHVAMGTYSDLDSEGLEVAFYTANRTWLVERFDITEWTNPVLIGDRIINLYNHNGNIPPKAGQSLYDCVSGKRRFGSSFQARRKALDTATLTELFAAYMIAVYANDEHTQRVLGIQIDMVEIKEAKTA